MKEIIAQIIGIFGMIFLIGSYQCKENKKFFLVQCMGCILFSINYILIGSLASALFNIIGILRAVTRLREKTHTNLVFGIICTLCVLTTIFTYENYWTLILLVPQLVEAYVIWYKNGGTVRKTRLFFISPIWLVNNSVFAFTVGGIICEIFTMVSAIVSLVRFRKDGFEE